MSLRIAGASADVRRDYPGARGGGGSDAYMSRLVKLVPAEVITIYPVVMQQAKSVTPFPDSPRWGVYLAAWVLLAIVIILRFVATREPGKGAQWGAILIAAVSFFIWVHVMDGDFGFERLLHNMVAGGGTDALTRGPSSIPDPAGLKQFVSNLSLTAWTLLAPVVYKGDDN